MEEILELVGATGLFIVVVFSAIVLWEVKFVMSETFEKGIVKINDDETYLCKLDDVSLAKKALKDQLKALNNKK